MNSITDRPFITDFPVQPELIWQMSRAEKYCLVHLLSTLKPEVSIEIGTFKGGSLQVIQQYSQDTYSIDISPAPKKYLEPRFPKVHFLVGQAKDLIHGLFEKIESEGKRLEFVLIDADHSKKGVFTDINAVLSYPHKHPITVLLHDSFNPQCRAGIKSVDYRLYPFVEYVELDFIPGSFWHNETYREMWGGLAIIKVNPGKINQDIEVNESQRQLFLLTRLFSKHLLFDALKFLKPLKKLIDRLLGKKIRSHIYYDFTE